MIEARRSGILLHITSLPSSYGIGDLGQNAFDFVDQLARAGQALWQILPSVPIGPGHSPYMSPSTFAGNTLLVCPDKLREMGLLTKDALESERGFETGRVDFGLVMSFKNALLSQAVTAFERDAGAEERSRFEEWTTKENSWLDDFALFETIARLHHGLGWTDWPSNLVSRDKGALNEIRSKHASEYNSVRIEQYLFSMQWDDLRSYANRYGVGIVGDLPIYVAQDSADVWSDRNLFQLNESGQPKVVAGVPPDYFSETGQYWGNPIYDWEELKRTGYDWWIRRLGRILGQVDLVRLDHFRGFEAYWEVPADEDTAVNGRWVKGPGADLFQALSDHFGELPIIAENLGVITKEVTALMTDFSFPGMAILQFALDGEMDETYLPHNLKADLVAYPGTHDNDTFLGWWQNREEERDPEEMNRIRTFATKYLKLEGLDESELPWIAIEALMASDAQTVIVPLQDVLGLDSSGRMNTPGTSENNWEWRLEKGQFLTTQIHRLREITSSADRLIKSSTD